MQTGEFNTLQVLRFTSSGAYLGDNSGNEVLLPGKYIPVEAKIGDTISVFLYTDSEDRLVATTQTPRIKLNEFAFLQVTAVNETGAFMDWGLEKDLLVPFREQQKRMVKHLWYVVYLYLDNISGRLVGSTRIRKFLQKDPDGLEPGQKVSLLVYERTDLGMNVIVDNKYYGLLYANEIFQPVFPGDILQGYIKKIREDKSLDISLQKQGLDNLNESAELILKVLQDNKGFLPLSDASDPEDIYDILSMSKKTFKRSVGMLYKQKLVRIEPDGLRLNE